MLTQFSVTNSGGAIADYEWTFGDAATPSTSTTASPSSTLGAVGSYNCSVQVLNITGSKTSNFILEVQIPPPDITGVSPQSGTAGAKVTFSLTNTGGPITTYSWDFGGGATPNTSGNESPTVTLGSSGTYNATVAASNGTGESVYNFTLTVSDP